MSSLWLIMSSLPVKKSWLALTTSPLSPQPWWLMVQTVAPPGCPPWLGTTSRSGVKTGGRARVLCLPQASLDQEEGRETNTEVSPALKQNTVMTGLAWEI